MARKKSIPDVKDDPRVVAMANCICFAVGAFRNKPVFNHDTKQMEGWHTWFKRVLADAGFTVYERTHDAEG